MNINGRNEGTKENPYVNLINEQMNGKVPINVTNEWKKTHEWMEEKKST